VKDWVVISIGKRRMKEEDVLDRAEDYRYQRKVSDI
jgi:hypothetical protein